MSVVELAKKQAIEETEKRVIEETEKRVIEETEKRVIEETERRVVEETRKEIAKQLLVEGCSYDVVVRSTKLSVDEVKALQDELIGTNYSQES